MKISISKKDIVMNYIGIFFLMGINYLILPFYLHFFNDDTLGIWYIFTNMSSFVSLFSFGFNPVLARNLAYCWGGANDLAIEGKSSDSVNASINMDLFYSILSASKLVFSIVAAIALLFLGTIGTYYISHVVTDGVVGSYKTAWFLFLSAIVMNMYWSYVNSFLDGIGRIYEKNISMIIGNIIRIILTALFLFMGLDLVGASLAYLLYAVVTRIIGIHFWNKALKENEIVVKPKYISLSKASKVVEKIWPNTWKTGLCGVSDYICSYAGTVITSFFLALSEVGVYSLSVQLVVAIRTISMGYANTQYPILHIAFINDDKKTQRSKSSLLITIYFLIFITGITALVTIGIPIVKIIRPGVRLRVLVILAIALLQFEIGFRNIHTGIISTMNNVECWKSFIISGLVSCVLCIVVLKINNIGVWGIILPTILVETVYNVWKWPQDAYSRMDTNFREICHMGIIQVLRWFDDKWFFKKGDKR